MIASGTFFKEQVFGFAIPTRGRTMENVKDPQERLMILEAGWEAGRFQFMCETIDDLVTNKEANDLASDFFRNKIRTIIHDQKTAELLCPKYSLLVKRPPLGHFYYETFGRPDVEMVDISKDDIQEITPSGLRTKSAESEFDVTSSTSSSSPSDSTL
ncbi:hypothetical protein LTR93_011721 [Exophiala xenobiotica]|nr:hypothetical protein LTR93_011721 [Exophiala xenobiotica]